MLVDEWDWGKDCTKVQIKEDYDVYSKAPGDAKNPTGNNLPRNAMTIFKVYRKVLENEVRNGRYVRLVFSLMRD